MMTDASQQPVPPGLASAWGLTPPPRRGPKPAYSVQRIVHAAVDLADAEGFGALSLPRIAQRLGLTTNALYRYVSSKDELLLLVADAGWGPPPATLPGQAHWRDAATEWARAVIDGYRARPWLLDLPSRGAPVTPNLLRWLEVLLEGMAGAGLTQPETLGCAMLLDGYARSTALLARDLHASTAPPVQSAAVTGFLQPLLHARGYPRLAAIMAGGDYQDDQDGLPDTDVEFGLERILDGIEVLTADRQPGAAGAHHWSVGRSR